MGRYRFVSKRGSDEICSILIAPSLLRESRWIRGRDGSMVRIPSGFLVASVERQSWLRRGRRKPVICMPGPLGIPVDIPCCLSNQKTSWLSCNSPPLCAFRLSSSLPSWQVIFCPLLKENLCALSFIRLPSDCKLWPEWRARVIVSRKVRKDKTCYPFLMYHNVSIY